MPESDGVSLSKEYHLDTKADSHQCGRKSATSASTSSVNLGRRGALEMTFMMC